MLEFLGWLFGLTPAKKKKKKQKKQCIVDHCPARQCTCQTVTEAPCNARGSVCLSHANEEDDEESE